MIDAFSILDPDNTGYLDYKKLHQLFGIMGYGKINALEIELLLECLDKDGDGKINL
jgi:Ca2+-binding EF-hand superfamily protein